MSVPGENYDDLLEPQVKGHIALTRGERIQLSTAVSLKRIADMLSEGLPVTVPQETYNRVTHLAEEAGQAFELGKRGR